MKYLKVPGSMTKVLEKDLELICEFIHWLPAPDSEKNKQANFYVQSTDCVEHNFFF